MTAPVTPETLTDEMICELIVELTRERDALDARPTTRSDGRDAYAKSVLLTRLIQSARVARKEKRARRGDSRNDCRRRICDAINARRAKDKP